MKDEHYLIPQGDILLSFFKKEVTVKRVIGKVYLYQGRDEVKVIRELTKTEIVDSGFLDYEKEVKRHRFYLTKVIRTLNTRYLGKELSVNTFDLTELNMKKNIFTGKKERL